MILVTVGTHEDPFDRLLRAVSDLPEGEDIVVQHGPSDVRPPNATCVPYMSYDELSELMAQARVVVCHAGVGSIMTALARRKRPVVLPRLHELGEHVDDHQVELCRRLDAEGLVVLVEDERRLPEALALHENGSGAAFRRPGALARELRAVVQACIGSPPAR